MAKSWKQIMEELGRVPPEQTIRDKQEMLKEKGMTYEEFATTEEWWEYRRYAFNKILNRNKDTDNT